MVYMLTLWRELRRHIQHKKDSDCGMKKWSRFAVGKKVQICSRKTLYHVIKLEIIIIK